MVSSRPEPEWDETEREWMLALDDYRRNVLCPCGCGYPRELSQSPDVEFKLEVPAPTRCHVRTALARAQRDSERKFPEALLWKVNYRG